MAEKEITIAIASMAWTKKASVFLLLLDQVLKGLDSSNSTWEKCAEARDTCRLWLSAKRCDPEHLAYYLDSDEMQNGVLSEQNFADGSLEQNSLVLILLIVGFFANQAYKFSDSQENMSAAVCEADEGSVEYIVDYVERVNMLGFLRDSVA
ncbi:Imm6 family immunity protein [Pseudomonas syringae]|nr:Imm6 family immunity protein [Pseudomonas syringae]